MATPLRFLHLHSSFNPGGKELRCARLINLFGPGIEHVIVSAQDGALGAASAIAPGMQVAFPQDFPALAGRPTPGRLHRIAEAMRGYDLVLTYNWGAMNAVMAHTLFGQALHLPPLVHHEDGFNEDEAERLRTSRNWYRRLALGKTSALVVPSKRLEWIARDVWYQPRGRVRRIANGINTSAYGRRSDPRALPRIIKQPGELWLGTLAGLRPVKNLPRLVRAFAALPEEWHLVILGEGPEREVILDTALQLDLSHRVHLPGHVVDPAKAIGLFDLFALSSESEQFPISVVEAMAAGIAAVSPDVGDVRAMLASANRDYVTRTGDEAGLADALCVLASDRRLREAIGAANQARARAEFDEKAMAAAYASVYAGAMGRAVLA